MYNKFFLSVSSLLVILLFVFHNGEKDVNGENDPERAAKIMLNRDMIINESALGDAGKLVDEQQIVGDPANETGQTPKSQWQIDWNKKDYFPISAVIDLGQTYKISHIYLFDAAGNGQIDISTGTPFSWDKAFSDDLTSYNKWKKKEINTETRYIQVKLYTQVGIPEIVVYGNPLDERESPNKKKPKEKISPNITMENFIGLNAFIDDPLEKIEAGGFLREYHVWEWDEGDKRSYEGYPNNKNAFNPSYAGGGGWNFDAYYKKLNDAGIVIATCIQESPSWLDVPSDAKPVPEGRDAENPASYKEHADHMFQVTARYGGTKIDDSLLKLAENQPRVSGLNYIQYYENWNEPDKDWKTRKEHFSPYEYAAMASADYDGHMGTLGKTYGVKNADKQSKLVMGGISALNLDYIKSIKFWSDWNREGSIPFDVINLHHYSNDGGKQRSLGTVGISPEADSLRQKLEKFVEYRNTYMPEKEIWVTEFGYDTNTKSVQRSPAIKGFSIEEVQGIWLIRSYLAIVAAGVDRAAMYMLRDTENKSGRQFSVSGLTGGKMEKHAPKPSWYYVYTLKNHLKNLKFTRDNSKGGIMSYEFKDNQGKKIAQLVWLPTSTGKEIKGHKISIPRTAKNPSLVEFTNNSITGATKKLSIDDQSITVDISEKPVILLYEI